MRPEAVSEALWPRLSEFIARNTGLHFPPERRVDLQRGLTHAAAEFGFDTPAACVDWLLSAPLSRAEMHTLASHLTIGETYFFRERKTLDVLAEQVLPDLISRRRGRDQRLRLWSAACATGEEPYSLAMLVRQLLPDWRDWRITILATDINQRFLEKAVAGTYGEWSFREAAPGFRERYFTRTPEGRYALLPEIRNSVTFMHLNLVQDNFPSLETDTQAMDLILCRNVLIYFTPAQARSLVEKLRHSLTDHGWLAVSPSECSQALFSSFTTENFPGVILYRKSRPEAAGPSPAPAPALPASIPQRAAYPVPLEQPIAPAAPAGNPEAMARELANEGRLHEARHYSERWIAADKVDAAAHYLHAMISQELGDREVARRSMQRAIYLDPHLVLGHFALGNLCRNEGKESEAGRHFSNALRLLSESTPEEILPESEGLTAGRLKEIITALMALAPAS